MGKKDETLIDVLLILYLLKDSSTEHTSEYQFATYLNDTLI